jgi:hypothetical protein
MVMRRMFGAGYGVTTLFDFLPGESYDQSAISYGWPSKICWKSLNGSRFSLHEAISCRSVQQAILQNSDALLGL